ncbi:MAG: hypothetical protein ACOX3P_03830 [Saccharofermentanales bacterium]|jgi:hypothetical protein|nr:hypothetical protein [Bacillota bacterium]NLB08609.1 hypothetical protein [Clostridiales bacterium]
MKIRVEVEVPDGKRCGVTAFGECKFLNGNGTLTSSYCDLFDQVLKTTGMYFNGVHKCAACLNATRVEVEE